ncbi:hypothetical protein DFJ73DRAFT_77493 [Zopfochytrium polystomum]|nr:hypothetical protein DFJ73DRAFT_77493 [Zopfochytrium polystomum]
MATVVPTADDGAGAEPASYYDGMGGDDGFGNEDFENDGASRGGFPDTSSLPANLWLLDEDPLDDGDVEGGIRAHMQVGNAIEDVVAMVVLERNALRGQNEQMWGIIEKQRLIIQKLDARVRDLELQQSQPPPSPSSGYSVTPTVDSSVAGHADLRHDHYSPKVHPAVEDIRLDTSTTRSVSPPASPRLLKSRKRRSLRISEVDVQAYDQYVTSVLGTSNEPPAFVESTYNPPPLKVVLTDEVPVATQLTRQQSPEGYSETFTTEPHKTDEPLNHSTTKTEVKEVAKSKTEKSIHRPIVITERTSSFAAIEDPKAAKFRSLPRRTVATKQDSERFDVAGLSKEVPTFSRSKSIDANASTAETPIATPSSSAFLSQSPSGGGTSSGGSANTPPTPPQSGLSRSGAIVIPPRPSTAIVSQALQQLKDEKKSRKEERAKSSSAKDTSFTSDVSSSPQRAAKSLKSKKSSIELVSTDDVTVQVTAVNPSPSSDAISYSLLVMTSADNSWEIERGFSDFLSLDTKVKTANRNLAQRIGKCLDRSIFSTISNLKIEQRIGAVEVYLHRVLENTSANKDVIEFLSVYKTDESVEPTSPRSDRILKEGFLIRKGANISEWKSFFFRCRPGVLESYEGANSTVLSSTKLKNCIVSRVTSPHDPQAAVSFIITEYWGGAFSDGPGVIPPDSKVLFRYTLSAQSDVDRDDWVRVLKSQIAENRPGAGFDESPNTQSGLMEITAGPIPPPRRVVPLPDTLNISAPAGNLSPALPAVGSTTSSTLPTSTFLRPSPTGASAVSPTGYSSPGQSVTPAAVLSPLSQIPGLPPKDAPVDDDMRVMLQVPIPLISVEVSLVQQQQQQNQQQHQHHQPGGQQGAGWGIMDDRRMQAMNKRVTNALNGVWGKRKLPDVPKVTDPSKVIFGASLEQALSLSRISENLELPAIVFRCVEYLTVMKAMEEEGIYRLSGQATVIQHLKDRFNYEYDIDLLSGELYDIHAVAGVLKLYLRELASPIIPKSLQRLFVNALDHDDRNDRILDLTRFVALLPTANYTLLRVLFSHLLDVIKLSDVNKMTLLNVGIVFSPTLGIPANVFRLLLAEFSQIFCWEDPIKAAAAKERILEYGERARAAAAATTTTNSNTGTGGTSTGAAAAASTPPTTTTASTPPGAAASGTIGRTPSPGVGFMEMDGSVVTPVGSPPLPSSFGGGAGASAGVGGEAGLSSSLGGSSGGGGLLAVPEDGGGVSPRWRERSPSGRDTRRESFVFDG